MIDNLIANATVKFSPQSAYSKEVVGTYYKTDKDGKKEMPAVEVPFRTKLYLAGQRNQRIA